MSSLKPNVNNTDRISVIVPFHNAANTIVMTLESLSKAYHYFDEILCVNDNSTDDSVELIEEFVESSQHLNVRIINQDLQKRGAAAARNLGVQYANGNYLLFLDADVIVKPGTIPLLVHCLVKEADVCACVALFEEYSLQNGVLANFQAFTVHSVYLSVPADQSPIMGTQCLLIRTKDFTVTGGFSEEFTGATVEDFELGYLLRAKGRIIRVVTDARIVHNHSYNFLSFSRNYFTKAKDLAYLMLAKNIPSQDTGYAQRIYIITLILLTLAFFQIVLFSHFSLPILSGLFLTTGLLIVIWLPFIVKVSSRFGVKSATIFFLLQMYVMVLGGVGGTLGVVKFLITYFRWRDDS